jgi:hypothetical protein
MGRGIPRHTNPGGVYPIVLLTVKGPVQLPLHEPYFDLTLIRAAHTKDPIITSKPICLLTYNRKANLLHALLSACDEWLVPIRGNIHRVMVIHDY